VQTGLMPLLPKNGVPSSIHLAQHSPWAGGPAANERGIKNAAGRSPTDRVTRKGKTNARISDNTG
jgi:hypothetical protein